MSRPQVVPAPIFSALICGVSLATNASATVTDTHGHRNRHAALTARTVSGAHQRADRVIQIRIRHQYRMVLRPAQRLDAFAALGAFGVDVFGNRRRTDEAQRFDFRRFNQCVHCGLVAMHHTQHAFRQAGFQ